MDRQAVGQTHIVIIVQTKGSCNGTSPEIFQVMLNKVSVHLLCEESLSYNAKGINISLSIPWNNNKLGGHGLVAVPRVGL